MSAVGRSSCLIHASANPPYLDSNRRRYDHQASLSKSFLRSRSSHSIGFPPSVSPWTKSSSVRDSFLPRCLPAPGIFENLPGQGQFLLILAKKLPREGHEAFLTVIRNVPKDGHEFFLQLRFRFRHL